MEVAYAYNTVIINNYSNRIVINPYYDLILVTSRCIIPCYNLTTACYATIFF